VNIGETFRCVICDERMEGFSHNAEPVKKGRCCHRCNDKFVIPARVRQLRASTEEKGV